MPDPSKPAPANAINPAGAPVRGSCDAGALAAVGSVALLDDEVVVVVAGAVLVAGAVACFFGFFLCGAGAVSGSWYSWSPAPPPPLSASATAGALSRSRVRERAVRRRACTGA